MSHFPGAAHMGISDEDCGKIMEATSEFYEKISKLVGEDAVHICHTAITHKHDEILLGEMGRSTKAI